MRQSFQQYLEEQELLSWDVMPSHWEEDTPSRRKIVDFLRQSNIETLKLVADRLVPFVLHDEFCRWEELVEPHCTCGLNDTILELNKVIEEDETDKNKT